MKADILALYQSLDQNDRIEVVQKIENNHLLGVLFELIDGITILSPVKVIYRLFGKKVTLKNQKDYLKRFYKLHAELKIIIVDTVSKKISSLNILERDLLYCKNLILSNNEILALKPLAALKEKIHEFEIFELLPEVLHLQVFLNKRMSPFDYDGINYLIEELTKSYMLRRALEKIILIQTGLITSHDELKKNIKSFQKIINDFPHSNRFRKMYHFYVVNNKLVFPVQVSKEKHAITRHLNNLDNLLESYPQIPMTFLNKDVEILNRFKQTLLVFSFNLLIENFEACNVQKEKKEALRIDNPKVYLPATFSELYHDYILFLMNEEFDKASQKTDNMELLLHLEGNQNSLIHVELQRALILFLKHDDENGGSMDLLKKLHSNLKNKVYHGISNKIYEAIFYLLWHQKDYAKASDLFIEQNLHVNFEFYDIKKQEIKELLLNLQKGIAASRTNIKISKKETAFGRILKKRMLKNS
ncbi:MAG: hypothetical protein ACI9O4_000869 [Chitinophagales bacterium]|jgi:hypothetical protein